MSINIYGEPECSRCRKNKWTKFPEQAAFEVALKYGKDFLCLDCYKRRFSLRPKKPLNTSRANL